MNGANDVSTLNQWPKWRQDFKPLMTKTTKAMTIKIQPEEKEVLKKLCTVYGLELFIHEQELKSEDTGLKLNYVNVTIEGIVNHEHVWHLCRTFSIEIEIQQIKDVKP